MSRAGLNRAEGQVVTTATGTDRVLIQVLDGDSGQFEPRQITIDDFLALLSASMSVAEEVVETEVTEASDA